MRYYLAAFAIIGSLAPFSHAALERAFVYTPDTGCTILPMPAAYSDFAIATGVNEQRQIVGTVGSSPNRPALWNFDSEPVILDTGSYANGRAKRINDNGTIVGYVSDWQNGQYISSAVLWDSSGRMTALPTLGGGNASGNDINNLGQVVGESQIVPGEFAPFHACLWNSDGTAVDLGTLGGRTSIATGINDAGQVTGYSDLAGGGFHAFLWDLVLGMQDLGAPSGGSSAAWDINADGHITGAVMGSGPQQGFLWDRDHGMQVLGTLPSFEYGTRGLAINSHDQIVGSDGRELDNGMWYDPLTGMRDLSLMMGLEIMAGNDITDQGVIVGIAAVPEPAMLTLTAVCALIATHRVRSRRRF